MRILSFAEAAEYLAMSQSGLRKLVRKRGIRFSQRGKWGRLKFNQEWLDEFVNANEVVPDEGKRKPVPKLKLKPQDLQPKLPSQHGLDYCLLDL